MHFLLAMTMLGNVVSSTHNLHFNVSLNDGRTILAFVPRDTARSMFRVVPGDPVVVHKDGDAPTYRISGFSACNYYRRYWEGDSGGRCEGWGASHFLFEVHPDGCVVRQIQLFDNGSFILYDECCDEDEYGGRSTVSLDQTEYNPHRISRADFFACWNPGSSANRGVQDGG